MGIWQTITKKRFIFSKCLFSIWLTFKILLILQDKAEVLPLLLDTSNGSRVKRTHFLIYSIVTALPPF